MLVKITDANGKDFDLDVKNSIYSVYDDLSSEFNAPFISNDQNNVEPIEFTKTIVNADGSEFNITDSQEDMSQIQSIDVHIEATHSNTVINNGIYTDNSMLRDFESYITPYEKPMLKYHNDIDGESIGRIKSAECVDSFKLPGTKTINVVSNIVDKDAIEKFLDGRYSTVSIGAYPKKVTCNHCGKEILKDGKFNFCGHLKGQVYNDKKCTWTVEDLEYNELSVVNSPADRYAQVYKIVVNKRKAKEDNNEDAEKLKNNLSDDILGALASGDTGNDLDNNNEGDVPPVQDNNTDEPETPINNSDEAGNDNNQTDTELELLKSKLSDLEKQLANSIKSEDNLKQENALLIADNEFLNTKLEKLTNSLEVISNSYKKDLLHVINKFSNNVEENVNFKEIKKKFDSLEYKREITTPTQAENPGLVNLENDKNVIKDNNKAVKSNEYKNTNKSGVISIYNY